MGRASIADFDNVRRDVEKISRERRRDSKSATVIADDRPLYIRSPDGNYWSLKIDNAGVLSATSVGTQL